ncbi:MAG: UPF0149 family protein [Pseudomonadota bacterium]
MLNFSSFIQNSEVSDALKPFLQQLGMSSSMAEVHALFTGLICSPSQKSTEHAFSWTENLDLDLDLNNLLVKEALDVLDSFYQVIETSLSSSQFDFQLAIVENDPIEIRLADFSLWVQNFLYGLGLNNSNFKKENNIKNASDQLQEILTDLVNISHAEDYQLENNEEDEQSLFELIEYVRVGVILIADELMPESAPNRIDIPEHLNKSLH